MDRIKDRVFHYMEVIRRTPGKDLMLMLARRTTGRIRDDLQYRTASIKGTGLTDRAFLKKSGLSGHIEPNSKEVLYRILDNAFLDSIFSADDRICLLERPGPAGKKEIIFSAEMACRHLFDLLGSGKSDASYNSTVRGLEGHKYRGKVSEGEYERIVKGIKQRLTSLWKGEVQDESIGYRPIDWHRDLISGYRWDSKKWYKHTEYGNSPGADIKVPRELSRCHHLVTMGQAYVLTGDEKYAKEYVCQLTDWIENNRPGFGSNWNCTMDVAIRAANWIVSLAYFRDSQYATDAFKFYLAKSLFQHGMHIVSNLEFSSITSNHYLSDISGLFMISLFFKKISMGKKWLDLAISQLKQEMEKQVNRDGTDFEASTCYHRLVLELFFYPLVYVSRGEGRADIASSGEKYFGSDFIARIRLMFDFILHAQGPDGRIPQIGDNDSGRFLIFYNRKNTDLRYLLAMAAVYFNDRKYRMGDLQPCRELLWVFGERGLSIWDSLKPGDIQRIGSRGFKDSGFYVMRHEEDHIFISCGPNGQKGNGGHAHNDRLGFELVSEAERIIVDPGTYVYTSLPEWRNRMRSTSSHNTVSIDGEEQNRFIERNLFALADDARPRVKSWLPGEAYDFLEAEHYGYKRLEDPVVHRRLFLYDKNAGMWLIKDVFDAEGSHEYDFYFQIAPGLTVKTGSRPGAFRIGEKGFCIIPSHPGGLTAARLDGSYSSGYGRKEDCLTIRYSKSVPGNWEQIFLMGSMIDQEDISGYIDKSDHIISEVNRREPLI